MDQFLSIVNALLAIKPKQGFVLLLGGLSIVCLNLAKVWPFDSISETWIVLAAVAALAGLVVLAVSLGAFVVENRKEVALAAKKARDLIDAEKVRDAQATANLTILTANEIGDLLWIIHEGNQRFQGGIGQGSLRSLTSKQIVTRPMLMQDASVFLVRDSVWAMRDDIVAQHPRARIPARSPFRYW